MAGGGSTGGGKGGAGGAGGNIYNQAAGATNAAFGAGNRLLGELNRGPGGVNPALYNATGYNAALQKNPATIASGMSTYMNPYTNEVINNTGRDIRRQTQMGINDLGKTAAGQHAFGGSRLGVAEGAAVGEGSRALGDISSALRSKGFDTAATLAGNDISNRMSAAQYNQAATNAARNFNATGATNASAANAGAINRAGEFNVGNRNTWLEKLSGAATQAQNMGQAGVNLGQQLQGATGADANTVNGIVQSLMGQSAGMFDSYTSSPFAGIERVLGALSGNPLSRTGTQTGTQTPGLKSQLATAFGMASRVP
jgi:hypothetical protein